MEYEMYGSIIKMKCKSYVYELIETIEQEYRQIIGLVKEREVDSSEEEDQEVYQEQGCYEEQMVEGIQFVIPLLNCENLND